MASGGSPHDDYKSRNSDFKPRSNRKPPRYGTSFEAELSLNSELQRGETGEYHSLPNNLTWTGGASNESQKVNKSKRAKELTQRGPSSDEPPTRFTRMKHTPATLPRTKFSSDSFGTTQRRAMDKLRQRLTFNGEEREVGEERVMKPSRIVELPANNERNVQQPSSGAVPTGKKGGHPLPLENGNSSNAVVPPIDSSKVIERLKQVREYLKQATSLFIALNSKSTSPDEATDEDLDQLDKLAKLIKHLKTQEKAYVDFVQRSIAVYRESSIDNTPSTSVVSLDGDHQADLVSVEGEDLEGLRQQHALLRKMVEQQRQLKELQGRQNALLDLQRDAENQLKEAENEGMRISSLLNSNLSTDRRQTSDVAGRSRSGTERSDESNSSQRGAVDGRANWKQTSRDDLRQLNRGQQELRNRRPANGQKPENFKNQRPARNEEAPVYESTGSVTPDNEAQALAMADAAQERLEIESKLMDLEAKKEQMDTLVEQLRELREMQLGKEMALPQQRSINETIENGEEDVPFTTKSAKDTGDNVDDEKILEALQLHRKLRKLQDVRDKLEKLKDIFGEEGDPSEHQSRTTARVNGAIITEDPVETDDTASVSARESATEDDGVTSNGVLLGSLDWILNSGIDDPDLLAKLRQVKAAKERVANLKQQKEQNNGAQPTSITNAGTSLVRDVVEDEDSGAVGGTDGETSGSISSTLMWQEDPEFQEKLRKLNAARKKLKRLQELVKKTEELPNRPNGEPYLPAELVEMSFSSDDYDEDNESEEENADPGNNGVANRGGTDSEEDATSEVLVEDARQTFGERAGENDLETEIAYMDKLTKQKAALSHLLSEKQKLLETQEQFKRLRTTDAVTQTRTSTKCKQLDTFIHNHTEASTSRQRPSVDSATQTFTAPNRSSKEQMPRPDALPSNSLLWWELRRQRELQEQKLKKRKETLMLEKKRRISGIDNGSDGGGNSVDDEGIGRSTLSADVTTATWGGSTQMSSTQNDSAVSDDGSSNETDEEILAQVEDDPSDGIVQAEEEEEEENSELEMFPGASDREKFKKNRGMKQNAREKRLLFEGLRKRDLERHERFKGWQNSLFSSGNKKRDKKQQETSDAHEYERYNRERDMWERQFNLQQSQLENTTSLCNTLLRDQQTLISLLLNRAENSQSSAFASGRNSFSQYQQRQQDAFQGIQNYFEQQRFLVQQQQMLQNLTECYSQMQQQHEDMLHLQRSFTQLFSLPSLEGEQNGGPSTDANEVPLNGENSRTSRLFNFRPETSVKETPPPSPFVNQAASVERHSNPPVSSSSQVHGRSTWSSGIRNRQFQFVASTSPETGVPSPQGNNTQGFNMQAPVPVKPVSARVVGEPKQSQGNPSFAYNSGAYTDSMPSTSNVVVGKQFPTPLRATAAALLAGQDKSSLRGVKRRKVDALQDKLETDSISSHQSSLPGDSEKPGTESDAQSDYSLFEALRDSIYSEVATLISQNESRPHFLIELFRELQLLSSDYLRQRALYSLRDLLTRFLKDDPPGGTFESAMGSYPWIESASEQTPSESAGLSETDQDQDKEMELKIPEVSTQGIYDYVEAVDSGSTLSTPNSTGHEPFASEFLGETVIHLDKALKSVRERRESENSSVDVNDVRGAGVQGDEITSSGGDVASESSLPDIQYPKIDTQALDRQIKKIMAEVIPCLNDHMEDSCSIDLLEYIRKMVMGMIQQKNEGRELNRFFHKQLESILQDSLAKFIGKRMKDCGEALLVDISEILFNELAFFKLMQELDGGITKAKIFNRQQKYQVPIPVARNDPLSNKKSTEMSDNTAKKEEEDEVENEVEMENENAEDQEAEEDDSSDNEFQSIGKRPGEKKPNEGPISREQLEQDEEALGRERDDAMAEEFDESRSHSELAATESAQSFKVVELSMSESKPLASSGSGEEDESEVKIEEEQPNAVRHEENPEGTNWSISMNGSSPQHNEQESQMAANGSREEQGAVGDQNKQDDDQDDYLPTKFTGLTEADLQVKIAEEQSRNEGIHGIFLSINDGEELVGGPSVAPEPEGTELVNGDIDEPEK